MKKFLCLFVLGVICAGLFAGCSGGVSQEEYDKVVQERDALKAQINGGSKDAAVNDSENKSAGSETQAFDENNVVKQIQVKEYTYTDSIKTTWTALILKNTSKFNLRITANVTFKDASGNVIGVDDKTQEAVDSGAEVALLFMNEGKPAKVEYTLSAKEEDQYECVLSALTCKATPAKGKAIIAVTNNAKEPAEFVQFTALFFNKGKLVSQDTGYTTDDDNELKPGKTVSKEANCFDNFDSVKVYLTGRR